METSHLSCLWWLVQECIHLSTLIRFYTYKQGYLLHANYLSKLDFLKMYLGIFFLLNLVLSMNTKFGSFLPQPWVFSLIPCDILNI